MALDWQGPAVTKRLRAAQVKGIDATMAAAAAHAKRHHAWRNRTATLEGSIGIQDYAAPQGERVRGLWGSADVVYALIHELGGTIRAKNARALMFRINGEMVAVKQVTIPARPYLRPAADAVYPTLAQRIRAAFERGEVR